MTAALLFSSVASAEDNIELPAVEITVPALHSLSTTYLTEKDLLRSGQRELSQVLRGTPGLAIAQGPKGGIVGLNMRGASASMGTLTIDGIPLHDAVAGNTNLNLFPAGP